MPDQIIGFVGLGQMAGRLLDARYALSVYDTQSEASWRPPTPGMVHPPISRRLPRFRKNGPGSKCAAERPANRRSRGDAAFANEILGPR